jgi:O-antigen ligase
MTADSLNQSNILNIDLIHRNIKRLPWPGYIVLVAALFLGFLFAWLPLKLATALVVGAAVILLILVQPLFGLALALLASPFGALEQLHSGIISLDSGQILLLLSLISWLGRGLVQKRIEIPRTFLNLPLFLFIFIGFISLLDAISIQMGLKELLKWLEIAVIMLLVLDLGREGMGRAKGGRNRSLLGGPPRTIWIVGMLLLAGLSQSVIGIWQFYLRDDGPEHFLVLERYYRAYGTFEQPNPFGGFMNLTVLLALGVLAGLITAWWLWLRHRSTAKVESNTFSPGWRVLLLTVVVAVIAGLTGAALLFSWSRGAWLAFGAGVAALALFWPRKRIYGVLILGFALMLALLTIRTGLMPESVTARLTGFAEDFTVGDVRGKDINDDNYSVLERQAHWQAGLDMLRDEITLGVGFGNYTDAYAQYALINWPDPLGHAHNYYINLLAEVGVIGSAAYLLFWTAVFWQTIRLLRYLEWPDRGIAMGLLASWVALAVHHLADKLYVNNIYIHLGVMLGLLQLLDWYMVDVRCIIASR